MVFPALYSVSEFGLVSLLCEYIQQNELLIRLRKIHHLYTPAASCSFIIKDLCRCIHHAV